MPRHSSYRSNHGLEPVGNDWSSSQLIIGIAVAIGFGVICFATGYVIALNDNPLEPVAANTPIAPIPAPAPTAPPATEAAAPAAANPTAVDTPPATSAPAPAPAPVTIAPAAVPGPSAAVKAPESTPAPEKPSETVVRSGLRSTPVNALPEPSGPTPMVRTPVDMNKAPAPRIEPVEPDEIAAVPGITPPTSGQTPTAVAKNTPPITPPTNSAAEVIPPAAKPAATPPPKEKEPEKPAKTAEAVPPPKTPTPEKAAPPTATKGSYGIQVASFDGPQRSTQAKEFQRNLKAKAQQNAEIIVAPDGTYHKVVVSGFGTREEAKAACEKMKSKPGLEGAWVVRLP